MTHRDAFPSEGVTRAQDGTLWKVCHVRHVRHADETEWRKSSPLSGNHLIQKL